MRQKIHTPSHEHYALWYCCYIFIIIQFREFYTYFQSLKKNKALFPEYGPKLLWSNLFLERALM